MELFLKKNFYSWIIPALSFYIQNGWNRYYLWNFRQKRILYISEILDSYCIIKDSVRFTQTIGTNYKCKRNSDYSINKKYLWNSFSSSWQLSFRLYCRKIKFRLNDNFCYQTFPIPIQNWYKIKTLGNETLRKNNEFKGRL